MKVRTGFVSNSSSSSFVIVGKEIKPNEVASVAAEFISSGRLYCCGSGNEAADFFPMTEEMWEAYENGKPYWLRFYDVIKKIGEKGKITKEDFGDNDEVEVFSLAVDNYSTDNVEDFKRRHLK